MVFLLCNYSGIALHVFLTFIALFFIFLLLLHGGWIFVFSSLAAVVQVATPGTVFCSLIMILLVSDSGFCSIIFDDLLL